LPGALTRIKKGASHVIPLLDAFRRDLNKLDRALVGAKEF